MKTKIKLETKVLHLIRFWLLLLTFPVFGQTVVKITGKISDKNNNQPIIGATIRVKGTLYGAATDAKGEFQLISKQSLPITLIVSYIGYDAQEVDVYEETPLDVQLNENQNRLSEVVVVGYGTQKREELTGSITSIPVSQIKATTQTSFVNGLQGLATGVQVTQTSGSPGGAASVRIRGGNSITGGNEPLYVIDGFPVYNDNNIANAGALNGGGSGAGTNVNPLSSISPNDIESIDVLKDAAATAIYGSRGANGVIIITSKKGKSGTNTISFDASYGVQQISHKIDLLNAKEWGIYKNDARVNNGKSPVYSASQLDSLERNSTDWQSAALRTAPVQNYQISFNGGNEQTRYAISLGVLDQQGIILGSNFSRYSGRVRIDSKLNKKLNVGITINDGYSVSDIVPDGTLTAALYMPPTVPIRDASGAYTFKSPYESAVANPIASLNLAKNQSKTNRILGSGFAEYQIVKGLKAKVLLGADLLDNRQNSYIPSTLFEAYSQNGIASVGSKFTRNLLNENTLTYSKTFSEVHTLEVLGGFTQQESQTEGDIANAQGFANNVVEYNDLGSGATIIKPSSNYLNWALESYLSRFTYNYAQKYFLTASFRADGSSRLGSSNKWGYFPSASVAWQLTKEKFLAILKSAVKINSLKLRLSAGKTGNQEISPYQSLSLLSAYSYPTATGSTITGYAPSQIANPDLKWETTAQYDGGADIGFLEDRVKIIFDAYYKKTSDLLLAVPLPLTSGFSTSLQNVGSVENKGIEISLNIQNFEGKFNWNTDISYSVNRNKVLSLSKGVNKILVPSEIQTGNAIIVGQPLGSFWGFKTNGLYKDGEEIPATPLLANTKVGDVNYLDLNSDGKITQADDQTVIGNAQPKFIFGLTNNFSYANFDLSVFFQGSYGNKVYSYILQQLQVPTGYQNVIGGYADHYTSNTTGAKYQKPNELITANPVSDLYVYDASYVRLKSVTLGYNIATKIISKLKINRLRLYITGQNLLTFTRYPGYDPEVNSYDSNSSRQGVDIGAYPSARTFTGGISITF